MPATARVGPSNLGRYHQLPDRVELDRGELRVDSHPRASPHPYVSFPSFKNAGSAALTIALPQILRLPGWLGGFFLGDAIAAAVWRRHTFSVVVENPSPEMMRMVFEKNMPLLAALLPDSTEDRLGTRSVLEDAFKFSCMLRGAGPDADALYRSFVPKLASTLHPAMMELVKPCRRSERGEVDRVGTTIFPGLVEVLPTPPIVQTVVRRAQVICECELLATSSPLWASRPPPLTR